MDNKAANSQNKINSIPKTIIISAKFLEKFSKKWVTLFAAKLFVTPIKHKIPKREIYMLQNSRQHMFFVPKINKSIWVYEYGNGDKKVLLVHGWSGRGTQLFKIADNLLKLGYSIVSFDAPAHGFSKGKTTLMPEFIASILELEKQKGPFDIAIGHSLGGMSVLNAIKQNLKIKKAVIIGSGDIIQDIIDDFVAKLKLKPDVSIQLKKYFENKYGENMDDYSAYKAAIEVTIPVLVIHDQNDLEVPVKAAHNIHKHLSKSQLVITNGLGHRKILGDEKVIDKIKEFITNTKN